MPNPAIEMTKVTPPNARISRRRMPTIISVRAAGHQPSQLRPTYDWAAEAARSNRFASAPDCRA